MSNDRHDNGVGGPNSNRPDAPRGEDRQDTPSAAAADAEAESRPADPGRARTRRHLVVLGIAVVGIVIGSILVVTGRDGGEADPSPTSAVTVTQGPLLPGLGTVTDQAAALDLIADLDVATLDPGSGSATTDAGSDPTVTAPGDVDLTEAGLQRCQQAIAQQNTDRSLGARLAAARLQVDRLPTFVVSYVLPASGDSPAGHRVVLADARTCRVLGAVDR